MVHPETKKTNCFFYLTFYSLDHFLQPKDKNTQHKLKISHLIVYNFSSLIIISYFQSDIHTHLEAMELRFSSICQSWLKEVNLMPSPSPNKSDTICQDRPGELNRFCFQNTMDALLLIQQGKWTWVAIQMLSQAIYTLIKPYIYF